MGQCITEICAKDPDIEIVAGIDQYDGIQNDYPVFHDLSAIDVKTDKATPVVAILGNSITDGRGSTTNHQNRWTDFLSDALNAEKPYGVLNLGIGGNCVVQGGLSEPAMKRFDRDILGQTGVDKLIIFEGTNDTDTRSERVNVTAFVSLNFDCRIFELFGRIL